MRECQEPRPEWMVAAGGRAVCELREGDDIHGAPEDCEPQPCINPAAHHAFVAPSNEEDPNGLPVPWTMPPLPPGWRVRGAALDVEGAMYLGRRDGMDAISIRLERDEPRAFAWVVLRNVEELRDFLARLEGMTPFLRNGMNVEVKYY